MWGFSNLLPFSQQRKASFKESSIVPSIVTGNAVNGDVEKEAEFYYLRYSQIRCLRKKKPTSKWENYLYQHQTPA